MDERAACALLKARFEAAGFQIEENRPFAEPAAKKPAKSRQEKARGRRALFAGD